MFYWEDDHYMTEVFKTDYGLRYFQSNAYCKHSVRTSGLQTVKWVAIHQLRTTGLKVRLRDDDGSNNIQVSATVTHWLIIASQMGATAWMVDRMLWCKCNLHLQPLSCLWSLPIGVWELGLGNESSWAIMNVLIQVCFDEIPPDWSQITEQNSESLLTTAMKATLAGNTMESIELLQGSLQDTLLGFFLSSLIPLWSLRRRKSDESVYNIYIQVFTLGWLSPLQYSSLHLSEEYTPRRKCKQVGHHLWL